MSSPSSKENAVTRSDIPKEQLTAFARWELASFDPAPKVAPVALPPAAPVVTAESAAAQLQSIQSKAYDDGHATGYQAGYAAGIQQAQTETARLQTLMQNLQTALTQIDEQLAQSLLDLSLEIAHKMVIEALHIRPEIILKVVSTAISGLPHFNQNAHLILHPMDAELVRKQMGEDLTHTGWKIITDLKIEPGGCRVETAHSNVDATNQARWQRIVESIGQHKSWLTTQN
ncbi:MAG: flagellar assembly protein FliH [Gallionella sp.]|nr:flagellar assembly protein FliH [Gallionella sp.]